MTAPRAVEEWIRQCYDTHPKGRLMFTPNFLCNVCARAYAQQQVAEEREACAKFVEAGRFFDIRTNSDLEECYQKGLKAVAAAIRGRQS